MLFSSLTFLYLYLPVTMGVWLLVPKRAKNGALLLFSLLFYFYGEPRYTLLLLFSSLSDYLHALYIEEHRGTSGARRALISSITLNLLLLGVFKYADFFIGAVNGLTGASIPKPNLPLPLGISFFTFQTMSYTVDVYRGKVRAERNLFTLAAYVCLFPQLVAGPIVRYEDVAGRLADPGTDWNRFGYGVERFCLGLGKKVLLANTLGELYAALSRAASVSFLGSLLMAVGYTLQIYFDFSGYSDMAVGLGSMLGFDFPENFRYPFVARSVTEFWRRWHMTLSRWFRDYLYIPLGGNRVSRGRWFLNILLVWAATGLWHGAGWNFLLWGAYFGLLLIIEKWFLGPLLEKAPRMIGHVYTLAAVVVSFVLFASESMTGLGTQLSALFGGAAVSSAEAVYYAKSYGILLLVSAIGSTPLPKMAFDGLRKRVPEAVSGGLTVACCLTLLALSTAMLVDGSFNPFLYFRF